VAPDQGLRRNCSGSASLHGHLPRGAKPTACVLLTRSGQIGPDCARSGWCGIGSGIELTYAQLEGDPNSRPVVYLVQSMRTKAVRRQYLWTFGLLLLALAIAGYWVTTFLKIDRCLDRGGRWNYEGSECQGSS
jgi:hypothetical protein